MGVVHAPLQWITGPTWSPWISLPILMVVALLLAASYLWIRASGALTDHERRAMSRPSARVLGLVVLGFPFILLSGALLTAFPAARPQHVFLESRSRPPGELTEEHRRAWQQAMEALREDKTNRLDAGPMVDTALRCLVDNGNFFSWKPDEQTISAIRQAVDETLRGICRRGRHLSPSREAGVPRWVIETVEFAILKALTLQSNIASLTIQVHRRVLGYGDSWTAIPEYLAWDETQTPQLIDGTPPGFESQTHFAANPWALRDDQALKVFVRLRAGPEDDGAKLGVYLNGQALAENQPLYVGSDFPANETFIRQIPLSAVRVTDADRLTVGLKRGLGSEERDVVFHGDNRVVISVTGLNGPQASQTLEALIHDCPGSTRLTALRQVLPPVEVDSGNGAMANVSMHFGENEIRIEPFEASVPWDDLLQEQEPVPRQSEADTEDAIFFHIAHRGRIFPGGQFALADVPLRPRDGDYLAGFLLPPRFAEPIVYTSLQRPFPRQDNPLLFNTIAPIGHRIKWQNGRSEILAYHLGIDAEYQGLFLGQDCTLSKTYNEPRFFSLWLNLLTWARNSYWQQITSEAAEYDESRTTEPKIVMTSQLLTQAKGRLLQPGVILLCIGLFGHASFVFLVRVRHLRRRRSSFLPH